MREVGGLRGHGGLGGLRVSLSPQSPLKARLNTKGSSNSGKHGNENLEHLAPERFLVFHESLELRVESLEFRVEN